MTPGEARVQALIDAADDLARWEPEDMADVFRTLALLPDAYGAVAEAGSIVAISAEDARAVRAEATSAAAEAASWIAIAAGGLGTSLSQWTMLRGSGTRWMPGSAA